MPDNNTYSQLITFVDDHMYINVPVDIVADLYQALEIVKLELSADKSSTTCVAVSFLNIQVYPGQPEESRQQL